MAKKEPLAIELKEISPSYPSLQDESEELEERKSTPSLRPQPRNLPIPASPTTGPASTPVVPITSSPPGISFAEQQRLRNSAPPQAPIVPVSQPVPPPIVSPQVPVTPGFRLITCSGCRGTIQYPASVMMVCCTACRATTATRPLINIVCYYCRHSAYYPADQVNATCRCGSVYAIRPAY